MFFRRIQNRVSLNVNGQSDQHKLTLCLSPLADTPRLYMYTILFEPFIQRHYRMPVEIWTGLRSNKRTFFYYYFHLFL